jgi:putative ABC transport system substrate-binding protein
MYKKGFSKIIGFIIAIILILLVMGIIFINKPKPEKVYHVGVLSGLSFFASTTDGFKEGMTALGYIEGKNIIYDVEETNDLNAYNSIINKFVADKVDLIFVFPTEAAQEAKKLTQGTGIPVVFDNALTEGMGLIDSIAKPGGNITGVRWPGPQIALKRFDVLHEILPQTKYIIIPYLKGYPIVASQLAMLESEASSSGEIIKEVPATEAADLELGLNNSIKGINGSYAVLCIPEPLNVTPSDFNVIAKFASDHKAPIGGCSPTSDHKSIFTVVPESFAVGKQASPLAGEIFKGTSAGDISVVSSENVFIVDYKAAQNLGINIPANLLNEATKIIH